MATLGGGTDSKTSPSQSLGYNEDVAVSLARNWLSCKKQQQQKNNI